MYLISACSLGVILTDLWISLRVGFDSSCMLRNERFIKRANKISFLDRIVACCRLASGKPATSDERAPLKPKVNDTNAYVAPKGTLEVRSLRGPTSSEPQLEVIGIQRSFPVGGDTITRRVLFQNISFQVAAGEIALVSGPSGVGKSQLLRTVAGLSPTDEGDIQLTGTNRHSDPIEWRKQVRYVTQYKVDVPGTPCDFIQRVTSFQSWKKLKGAKEDMLTTTRELVQAWGLEAACLEKEWALLSGGEAQRVIVALALASRPKALLFDESTSSLDMESKLRVEGSVESFAEKHGISVLWITHDQEQAERMSDKTVSL
jgi:ABC-type iron transport system FetAB ATPase subunit